MRPSWSPPRADHRGIGATSWSWRGYADQWRVQTASTRRWQTNVDALSKPPRTWAAHSCGHPGHRLGPTTEGSALRLGPGGAMRIIVGCRPRLPVVGKLTLMHCRNRPVHGRHVHASILVTATGRPRRDRRYDCRRPHRNAAIRSFARANYRPTSDDQRPARGHRHGPTTEGSALRQRPSQVQSAPAVVGDTLRCVATGFSTSQDSIQCTRMGKQKL